MDKSDEKAQLTDSSRGVCVAVVEGDVAVREVCKTVLQRRSYDVLEFGDAQSALNASQHEKFDIAIIDWVLPDCDGFTLFKALKEKMPNLVGIAISGQSSHDVVIQSLNVGMLWMLIKPFTILELLSVVDAARRYVQLIDSAERSRFYASMAGVVGSLLRQIELESLGELIIREAVEHTSSDAASLLVADKFRECLKVVAAFGTPSAIKGVEVKPIGGIVGLAIQLCKPIVINRETIRQAHIAGRLRYGGKGSAISFPLGEDNGISGVLNITRFSDEPQLSDRDVDALNWFISQTSVALSRSLHYERLKESFFGIAGLLISLYEAQDPYRRSHSERVAEYACALAAAIGCSMREIELLKASALLYQVGLHQIDKSILHKPSKLTDDEYEQIKRYPELSLQLLRGVPLIWDVGEIIISHREHYDGSGYPMGKRADEIPLLARVLSVADTYVALTSRRPHRPAMSEEQAREELLKMAGKELDEKLTNIFVSAVLAKGQPPKAI
ncbi:MAG: response regulator [Armatimonadota bacterium]|nr:response regulator [Armatimonadota bacterium]MCX7776823.1 response regulator [Armatimonadota bacterium]MDW8024618.1 response regulator [Armatimonadota bacterium]